MYINKQNKYKYKTQPRVLYNLCVNVTGFEYKISSPGNRTAKTEK